MTKCRVHISLDVSDQVSTTTFLSTCLMSVRKVVRILTCLKANNACRVNKKKQHLICIFYLSLGRVVLKFSFVRIQIRLAVTDRTSPADLPFFLCLFCLLRDPILFLKLSIILTEHILVSQNDKIMWLCSFISKHLHVCVAGTGFWVCMLWIQCMHVCVYIYIYEFPI